MRHDHVVALHIGAHKTGTSVIQDYLRRYERYLGRKRILALHRAELRDYIGWGEKLRTDPGPLLARVDEFAAQRWYTTLVGSFENVMGRAFQRPGTGRVLYPDGLENLAALGKVLGDRNARILLSIRPTHEFVESYYLQTIHEGGHHDFQSWYDRLDLDRLSWRPFVQALYDGFGRDRVEIIDFGVIRQGQNAYLQHFFARIDRKFDFPIDFGSQKNRSLSERGLELALAINPMLRTSEERRAFRVFLQRDFSNLDYPRPTLLTDDQRAVLRARYDDEYAELVSARPPVPTRGR